MIKVNTKKLLILIALFSLLVFLSSCSILNKKHLSDTKLEQAIIRHTTYVPKWGFLYFSDNGIIYSLLSKNTKKQMSVSLLNSRGIQRNVDVNYGEGRYLIRNGIIEIYWPIDGLLEFESAVYFKFYKTDKDTYISCFNEDFKECKNKQKWVFTLGDIKSLAHQALATTSKDRTSTKINIVKVLKAHNKGVNAVDYSEINNKIASAGSDFKINLWGYDSGKLLQTLNGHTDRVWDVDFSSDGKYLLSAGDSTVRLWDSYSGKLITILGKHSKGVSNVIFSPNGKKAVSGGYSGKLKFWDIANRTLIKELLPTQTFSPFITALTFSSDGETFISGDFGGTIRIWNGRTGKLIKIIQSKSMVSDIAYFPNKNYIASVHREGKIRIWNINTGKLLRRISAHDRPISTVSISKDGSKIMTGAGDSQVKIWDSVTFNKLASFYAHTGFVQAAFFVDRDTHILTGGYDNIVKKWSIKNLLSSKKSSESPVKMCETVLVYGGDYKRNKKQFFAHRGLGVYIHNNMSNTPNCINLPLMPGFCGDNELYKKIIDDLNTQIPKVFETFSKHERGKYKNYSLLRNTDLSDLYFRVRKKIHSYTQQANLRKKHLIKLFNKEYVLQPDKYINRKDKNHNLADDKTFETKCGGQKFFKNNCSEKDFARSFRANQKKQTNYQIYETLMESSILSNAMINQLQSSSSGVYICKNSSVFCRRGPFVDNSGDVYLSKSNLEKLSAIKNGLYYLMVHESFHFLDSATQILSNIDYNMEKSISNYPDSMGLNITFGTNKSVINSFKINALHVKHALNYTERNESRIDRQALLFLSTQPVGTGEYCDIIKIMLGETRRSKSCYFFKQLVNNGYSEDNLLIDLYFSSESSEEERKNKELSPRYYYDKSHYDNGNAGACIKAYGTFLMKSVNFTNSN